MTDAIVGTPDTKGKTIAIESLTLAAQVIAYRAMAEISQRIIKDQAKELTELRAKLWRALRSLHTERLERADCTCSACNRERRDDAANDAYDQGKVEVFEQ